MKEMWGKFYIPQGNNKKVDRIQIEQWTKTTGDN